MPIPAISDVHIDVALTNISLAFMQDPANFVAGVVFPVVPSPKQSNKYFTFPADYWARTSAAKRDPGAESAGGGHPFSTGNFFADRLGGHKHVSGPLRMH